MKRAFSIGLVLAVALVFCLRGAANADQIDGATVTAAYLFRGNVNDTSGNGFNGTVNGTTTYGVGPGGRSAFSFDGGTNIATASTTALQLNNHSFSVDAWVNFNDLSGDRAIFGTSATGSGDQGLHLQERIGGSPAVPAIMMGFYGDDLQPNAPALHTGTWVNVAWVFDASTNTQSIYENGVLEATRTSAGAFNNPGTIANPTIATIGADCCGGGMSGLISNLYIFNSALTQAQVQAAANAPEPSSIALFGFGAAGLFVAARRRLRA